MSEVVPRVLPNGLINTLNLQKWCAAHERLTDFMKEDGIVFDNSFYRISVSPRIWVVEV